MLTKQQLLDAPEDDYMNDDQLAFFKHLLQSEIARIESDVESAHIKLKEQQRETDELDKAAVAEGLRTKLRFLDRQTKLIPKLREALRRIEKKDFGFCEVTGDPIGIKRLLARPTATLSAEEKTRQEELEKTFAHSRP